MNHMTKDGKEITTSPDLITNTLVEPPLILNLDQMEKVVVDAKH